MSIERFCTGFGVSPTAVGERQLGWRGGIRNRQRAGVPRHLFGTFSVWKKYREFYKKGHVLGKETITIYDLLELLRFIAGKKTLTPQQMEAANITGAPGAKPGVNDLLEMLRYLANKPSKLS